MINKVRSNRQKGDRTRSRLEKGQHFFQHNSTLFKYLKNWNVWKKRKTYKIIETAKNTNLKELKKNIQIHVVSDNFHDFAQNCHVLKIEKTDTKILKTNLKEY